MDITIERKMGYMTKWHDVNRKGKQFPIVGLGTGTRHHEERPNKNNK